MRVRTEPASGTLSFLATALAGAICAGLTVTTLTALVADVLRSQYGSTHLVLRLYWIAGGTLAGVFLAGFVGWRLLEPVTSTYRRGGLAIVSAFATVVLMLVSTRVFDAFGRNGLLGLAGFCALAFTLFAYQARRLRRRVQL